MKDKILLFNSHLENGKKIFEDQDSPNKRTIIPSSNYSVVQVQMYFKKFGRGQCHGTVV